MSDENIFMFMESSAKGLNDYNRRFEDYWERLDRIASTPYGRLFRADQISRHETVYVVVMPVKNEPIRGDLNYIRVKTLCAMEVLNEHNPACWTCVRYGKKRGLLHA